MIKGFPLIKVSGKAFAPTVGFDDRIIRALVQRIIFIINFLGVGLAIVPGGGNLWRGNEAAPDLDPDDADYAGMTATILNGKCLEAYLKAMGVRCQIISAFNPGNNQELEVDHEYARSLMADGVVVIFVGGTGKPRVTTDTGVALRAAMCGIKTVLVAKDKSDEGVYDKDPNIFMDAKHIPEISHAEILDSGLKVMDRGAHELAIEHNITFLVFGGSPSNPWQTIVTDDPQVTFSVVHP